jgi:hypothetical protein
VCLLHDFSLESVSIRSSLMLPGSQLCSVLIEASSVRSLLPWSSLMVVLQD